MNEKGLVVGLHFVNTQHRGEGFLATTIVRMLLEQCGTVDEAVEFITTIPHGYCYNYSMTDGSGKSVIVEATPEKQFVHFANPLICTNHFETPELTEKNRDNILGSMKRKEYVSNLLTKDLTPKALYHHFNDGNSPLFFKYYQQFFGTLHTVVYSPKDLTLIVGIGENCEPKLFSLKIFLNEDYPLPNIIKGKIAND